MSGFAHNGPRKVLSIAIGGRSSGRTRLPRRGDRFDVDQSVGRVGGAFEIDERDPAHLLGLLDHRVDFLAGRTGGEVDIGDSELAEDLGDERLGRRVERPRVDHHVARLAEGRGTGRDRRHSAREGERVVGIFPHAQPVLEDLLIGAVEARIDQAFGAARALAGHPFEEALSGGRIFENEGGGEEDRRLQ
jgi:hypothetical protein